MRTWEMKEAKAELCELIKLCFIEGPQALSVDGKEAVLLSKAQYDKLANKKPHLVDFLRHSPLVGLDLDLTRDQSLTRY